MTKQATKTIKNKAKIKNKDTYTQKQNFIFRKQFKHFPSDTVPAGYLCRRLY